MRRAFIVALIALSAAVLSAQDREPSTLEERAHALQLIRSLETDPLARQANDARQWLSVWLVTVPDITVRICGEFLPPLLASKKNHAPEIFMQSAYSAAGFVIENPQRKDDIEAQYLAGVEGALRSYEAIRKQKPRVRWPLLDELIAKRGQGELPAYVKQKMKGCEGGS